MVRRVTLSSLEGINGTVFVYGQTGSGKTYTMLGTERMQKQFVPNRTIKKDDEEPGILIHAMQDLFSEIEQDSNRTYFLRCAYVEIYNEQVFDLLRSEQASINESLQLVEDGRTKDFFIRGVTEQPVHNNTDVLELLTIGENNRHYAETKLNHASSRSHTVFRVWVQSVTKDFLGECMPNSKSDDGELGKSIMNHQVTQSVLNFVDLAGSEKVSSHLSGRDEYAFLDQTTADTSL